MCLAEAPQPNCDTVKAELLKVDAAGSQGCDQQSVQVLEGSRKHSNDYWLCYQRPTRAVTACKQQIIQLSVQVADTFQSPLSPPLLRIMLAYSKL
jgi:hypothetical protein